MSEIVLFSVDFSHDFYGWSGSTQANFDLNVTKSRDNWGSSNKVFQIGIYDLSINDVDFNGIDGALGCVGMSGKPRAIVP